MGIVLKHWNLWLCHWLIRIVTWLIKIVTWLIRIGRLNTNICVRGIIVWTIVSNFTCQRKKVIRSQFKPCTMKYYCFVCFQQFSEIRHIFEHLKKLHLFRDNKNDLKCVVLSPPGCEQCAKIYKTFDSLRTHIKKCKPIPIILDKNNEVYHL